MFAKISTWLKEPVHRKYVYGVVVALVPVLVASGLLTVGLDQTILLVVASVLGVPAVGLAAKNTNRPEEPEEVPEEVADEDETLLGN